MRTPPAYAMRPRATVCRPLARISLAGLVADRVLSVAEDVLFPSKETGARRMKAVMVAVALVLMAGGSVAVQPATPVSAAAVPQFDHIFLVVMENHAYSQIIGNTAGAPYINNLAQEYGLATNYTAIHPSQPSQLPGTGCGFDAGHHRRLRPSRHQLQRSGTAQRATYWRCA